MIRRGTRGFALIPTLWVIVGASSLAMAAAADAHDEIGAARNRASGDRAYWVGYGCAERLRYILYQGLWPEGASAAHVVDAWRRLDEFLPRISGCDVRLVPGGLRFDANTVSAAGIRSLLREMRMPIARADSIADAVMDWRDADDAPRPFGAERAWYAAHQRPTPRNGPLMSTEELRLIRGLEAAEVRAQLGVAEERVLWTRAPRPVLAALPGITGPALDVFQGRRGFITDFLQLASFPELPAAARDTFVRNSQQLASLITAEPSSWIVTVTASHGQPPITSVRRLRFALGDRRLLILESVATP